MLHNSLPTDILAHYNLDEFVYATMTNGKFTHITKHEAKKIPQSSYLFFSPTLLDIEARGFSKHNIKGIVGIPFVSKDNVDDMLDKEDRFNSFMNYVSSGNYMKVRDGNKHHWHLFLDAGIIDSHTITAFIWSVYRIFGDYLDTSYPIKIPNYISMAGYNGVRVCQYHISTPLLLANIIQNAEAYPEFDMGGCRCIQRDALDNHDRSIGQDVYINGIKIAFINISLGYGYLLQDICNKLNILPIKADKLCSTKFLNILKCKYLTNVLPMIGIGAYEDDIKNFILIEKKITGYKYIYDLEKNNRSQINSSWGEEDIFNLIMDKGTWRMERLLFSMIRLPMPILFRQTKRDAAVAIAKDSLPELPFEEYKGKQYINLKTITDARSYVYYKYTQTPRKTIKGKQYVEM
jgi:hypothetical protein